MTKRKKTEIAENKFESLLMKPALHVVGVEFCLFEKKQGSVIKGSRFLQFLLNPGLRYFSMLVFTIEPCQQPRNNGNHSSLDFFDSLTTIFLAGSLFSGVSILN